MSSHAGLLGVAPIAHVTDEDGAAVVMVTHDPAAARYGSREVHLVDGRATDVAVPGAER